MNDLLMGMSDQSSVALRILGPRATVLGAGDAIENVNTSNLPDGAMCWVTDEQALYRFILESTATADGSNIIEPNGGPGRWFRETVGPQGADVSTGLTLGTITSGSSTVEFTSSESFPAVPGGFREGFLALALTCTITTPTILRVTARQGGTGASVMLEQPLPNLAGNEVAVSPIIFIDASDAGVVTIQVQAALAGGNTIAVAAAVLVTRATSIASVGELIPFV